MRRIALVSVLLMSTGCVAHYGVIREATPNPLAGKMQFSVAPLDFTGAVINDKPVGQWVSEGGADEAKDWPLNTANATKEFYAELVSDKGSFQISESPVPPPSGIVVVPVVERIEQGVYAVAFAQPTDVRVHVRVYANGKLADELVMHDSIQASLYRPSFNQRLADCMQDIARDIAGYLRDRSATH